LLDIGYPEAEFYVKEVSLLPSNADSQYSCWGGDEKTPYQARLIRSLICLYEFNPSIKDKEYVSPEIARNGKAGDVEILGHPKACLDISFARISCLPEQVDKHQGFRLSRYNTAYDFIRPPRELAENAEFC
jgi:hypothetical protein